MRRLTFALAFATLALGTSPALAAPCKDTKGKFIKCPPAKPAPGARCKDGNGKFAKCGTKGAKPM